MIESDGEDLFIQGRLHIGEPVTVPVIRALKKEDAGGRTGDPGLLSRSLLHGGRQAIRDCDFCVLVTEPTPFGLHDLKIAVELVRNALPPLRGGRQ